MQRIVIIYLFFLSFLCCRSTAAETRPAVLSSEELRQRLVALQSEIRTWLVEYKTDPSRDPARPPGLQVHRIVAASAPDQFSRWNAKAMDQLPSKDDPLQLLCFINSSSAVYESPMQRTFSVSALEPNEPLPENSQLEFLFTIFGWWPFEGRPAPTLGGKPIVLFDVARSPKYIMRSEQELINGCWCHVLEYPGHERLWFDCERNCAFVAREIYHPKTGALAQRIEMKGHRQVKPGIWVPTELHNTMFEDYDQHGNQRKFVDSIIRIVDVRINDQLPDTLFRFEPRPGYVQIFKDRHFEQKVPGGTELLDEIVNWIQRYGQVYRVSTDRSVASIEAGIEYIVLIVCVVAIFVLHWRKGIRGRV